MQLLNLGPLICNGDSNSYIKELLWRVKQVSNMYKVVNNGALLLLLVLQTIWNTQTWSQTGAVQSLWVSGLIISLLGILLGT